MNATMQYKKADITQLEAICHLVQNTIKTIYPKYYPKEVVDFFCELHSKEAIAADIENNCVSLLSDGDILLGTGSYKENHITRVYVNPAYQKQGYGTYIIKRIEEEIAKNHDKIVLDASLPAAALYEKLGFHTIKHGKHEVENGVILVYEIMEKAVMEIRELSQSDNLSDISHVYEISWKYAYQDILPQQYLDSIPEGRWVGNLTAPERHTLIMLKQDKIIGTVSFGKARDSKMKGYGEIISLYFLPEYIGKGYGKRLLQAAVEALSNLGYCAIYLWVLEENIRARNFYEKAGFIATGRFLEDEIGGKKVKEIQYSISRNSCPFPQVSL